MLSLTTMVARPVAKTQGRLLTSWESPLGCRKRAPSMQTTAMRDHRRSPQWSSDAHGMPLVVRLARLDQRERRAHRESLPTLVHCVRGAP